MPVGLAVLGIAPLRGVAGARRRTPEYLNNEKTGANTSLGSGFSREWSISAEYGGWSSGPDARRRRF